MKDQSSNYTEICFSSYPESLAKAAIELITREGVWQLINGKSEQVSNNELLGGFANLSDEIVKANKRNASPEEISTIMNMGQSLDQSKLLTIHHKVNSFLVHLSVGVELLVKAYALAIETNDVINKDSKKEMFNESVFDSKIACDASKSPWLEKTLKDADLIGYPLGAIDMGTMGQVIKKLKKKLGEHNQHLKSLEIFCNEFRNKVAHTIIKSINVDEISRKYLDLINDQVDLCKAAGLKI